MKKFLLLLLFILNVNFLTAQNQNKLRFANIAFYNIENLFDTIKDPVKNDIEFTPEGKNNWTSDRYFEKLDNIAFVIDKIGNKFNNSRPTIIGLSEIENHTVLKDLTNTKLLKSQNYGIVHYDSPDRRGIDVALLYNPKRFKVILSKSYTVKIEDNPNFATRDQLYVSGLLDGDTLDFIVLHWPSRRGGQERSEPLRIATAKLTKHIIDSVVASRPNAQIITMGDLNDDPIDKSVYIHLNAKGNPDKLKESELYNPFHKLYKDGIGTLAYRGKWNLFDQIIITKNFLNKNSEFWQLHSPHVFNEQFLIQREGKYAGNPYRTFAGGTYIGGYSDHFPVYIIITKSK